MFYCRNALITLLTDVNIGRVYRYNYTIRYDTIAEFNVDSKAECGQFSLAHVARNKQKRIKKKEIKTNKYHLPT